MNLIIVGVVNAVGFAAVHRSVVGFHLVIKQRDYQAYLNHRENALVCFGELYAYKKGAYYRSYPNGKLENAELAGLSQGIPRYH